MQSGLLASSAPERERGDGSCERTPRARVWPPDCYTVEFAAEFCWIFSEAAWILLIPPVCIPIGLLAFILMSIVAAHRCASTGRKRMQEWLPLLMQAYWLLTNFVWMTVELLWDSPLEQTPWGLTPMDRGHDDLYEKVNFYCILSFLVAPLIWVVVLACQVGSGLWQSRGVDGSSLGPSCRPALGLFCEGGYIAAWAVMDAVWAAELFWACVLSCGVTLALIAANSAWESGRGLRGMDRTDFVWVLWTVANMVWIIVELAEDDNLTLRYVAAILALIALGLLCCSLREARCRAAFRAGMACDEPTATTVAAPS